MEKERWKMKENSPRRREGHEAEKEKSFPEANFQCGFSSAPLRLCASFSPVLADARFKGIIIKKKGEH